MSHANTRRTAGFVLIEALIALVLIAIGLVAVSKLQTLSLFGSGDGRARAEAAHLSQQKIEELRNLLQEGDFTALASGEAAINGSNGANTFKLKWTVTPDPDATLVQHLVQVNTTWTDARGDEQRLDMNTRVAWDDPAGAAKLSSNLSKNLISPTGEAVRGGELPTGLPDPVLNHDGTKIYTDPATKKTYLTKGDGTVILTVPPKKDGTAQAFTTITGRVYFDPTAGNNALPSSANVLVRLSSEGECIFNNAANSLGSVNSGGNAYSYFTYTCYVGPGWYGNVGVTVVDTNGNGGNTDICVGDPGFNNGVSNSTQTSAHSIEAAVRTYRGFRASATASGFQSTGVAGGRRYGSSFTKDANGTVTAIAGPFDGKPRPSDYPAFYPGIAAGDATNYFNQDFLITDIKGKASCATKMAGGLFTRNAGQYVCISPDSYTDLADQCPDIWPGYQLGVGGSINYTLTVVRGGNGSGSVTSAPVGISCGNLCLISLPADTVVTLTAAAAADSVFDGWTNCPNVVGNSCTLTLAAAIEVGVSFSSGMNGATQPLALNKVGDGSVSSEPAGINCGGACSFNFADNAVVTLTATPANGQQFTSWGGDCLAAGSALTCTVTMSAARNVTATFTSGVQICTTTMTGSAIDNKGLVSATPDTGNAGDGCSRAGNTKVFNCTFTAPKGTMFTLRNYRTDGNAQQNYDVLMSIEGNCSNYVNLKFE